MHENIVGLYNDILILGTS